MKFFKFYNSDRFAVRMVSPSRSLRCEIASLSDWLGQLKFFWGRE